MIVVVVASSLMLRMDASGLCEAGGENASTEHVDDERARTAARATLEKRRPPVVDRRVGDAMMVMVYFNKFCIALLLVLVGCCC